MLKRNNAKPARKKISSIAFRIGGNTFALLFPLVCAGLFGQTSVSDLETLQKEHRWAELYDAAAKNPQATYYQAVAAAVFNKPEAETLFQEVIRQSPASDQAYDSYDWLANLYLKTGRYQHLTTVMKSRWQAFPNKKANASEQKEIAPFEGLPNQKNGKPAVSVLHHDPGSLSVPITINGKQATFFFDDGADFSCISEQEARNLGMEILKSSGTMGSMTKDTSFHMAYAKSVTIGNMHFSDVSFAVLPDDKEPMSLVPMEQRGIIGLPLMVATGTFRWRSDGTLTIGEEPGPLHPAQSNLFFDSGKRPVLTVSFQNEDILMALDTGATTTDIYAPFAQKFSTYLKQHGKTGHNEIRGFGGADTFDSIDVPELPFQLGGRTVLLRPAHVLTTHTERRKWIFGNLGKDLLMQTAGFTIDFGAMTLKLE